MAHRATGVLLALLALTVGVRLGLTCLVWKPELGRAVSARLGITSLAWNPEQSGMEYGNIASHLVQGHGFSISLNHWWPRDPPAMKTRWMMPFYPLVLAGSKLRTPDAPQWYVDAYVLQGLVAGGVGYLLYRLGASVYGARAGLFAVLLFALYPSFVYTCARPHPLYWEFAALLLALVAWRAYVARGRAWCVVGCALATLWAIYIRSAWLLLVPVVLVLAALGEGGWRRRGRGILAFALLVVAGIAPWAARNWLLFGSPGLSVLEFPFWEGHNSLGLPTGYGPGGTNVSNVAVCHPTEWAELNAVKHEGEPAIMGVFWRAAWRAIRERPWHQLVVLPAKRVLYYLLWDPNHPQTRNWPLYRLPYLALLGAGVIGLVLSWRGGGVGWRFGIGCVLGVWLAGCAKVALFHYLFRYRMPAELMLMLPAGYALDRLAGLGIGEKSQRREGTG